MRYSIITKSELSNRTVKKNLKKVLAFLEKFKTENITVIFGWYWAHDFNEWREMILKPKDVMPLVDFLEQRKYGELGSNDLIIKVNFERRIFIEFNF